MSGVVLALLTALAGGLGAVLRALVDGAVRARVGEDRPVGIVVVNLTGAFALGLVGGLVLRGAPPELGTVLGTGLLGGYTTFSTASLDTARLVLAGRGGAALVHGVGVLVVAVGLAAAGWALGSGA
ncbi:fluoride efflux transporter FluC [Cellulomonas endophytica]|uniref:fluoride efflux transporter FluC n=1 Tax=Cellulomonas endophytica TaxID=2494735 RepID=UPI001011980D|nr:CrcB family protein [Cellulomonas endophytica]